MSTRKAWKMHWFRRSNKQENNRLILRLHKRQNQQEVYFRFVYIIFFVISRFGLTLLWFGRSGIWGLPIDL